MTEGKTLIESAAVAFPTAIMAMLGWFGYTVTKHQKIPEPVVIVGGLMLSGFVAWVTVLTLMNTGMHPEVSAPIAAVVGAAGKDGFDLLVKKSFNKLDKE